MPEFRAGCLTPATYARITRPQSDDEFEAVGGAVAEEFERSLRPSLRGGNPRTEAASLEELLASAVPADHPSFGPLRQKLAVLAGNPWWPHERKVVLARRLIKNLA